MMSLTRSASDHYRTSPISPLSDKTLGETLDAYDPLDPEQPGDRERWREAFVRANIDFDEACATPIHDAITKTFHNAQDVLLYTEYLGVAGRFRVKYTVDKRKVPNKIDGILNITF